MKPPPPPAPSNVFEINKPPGVLGRVCTVGYSVFTDRFIIRYILEHFFPRKWSSAPFVSAFEVKDTKKEN